MSNKYRLTSSHTFTVGQTVREQDRAPVYTVARVRGDGLVTTTDGRKWHPILLRPVA